MLSKFASSRRSILNRRLALVAAAACIAGVASTGRAQVSGSWNLTGGGNFGTGSNWSGSAVPGTGGTATFGPIISAPSVVTLNVNTTLGGLTFQGTNGYTLAPSGGNSITLNGLRRVDVISGTHTINAPISGTVGLNKVGVGTLVLGGSSTYTGNTAVNAGVLRVTSGTALGPAGTNNALGAAFGGVLEIAPASGDINLGVRSLGLATTDVQAPNGALRSVSGNNTLGGDIFLLQRSSIGVDAGTLTLTGDFIDNGVAGSNGIVKVGAGDLVVDRFGGQSVVGGPGQVTLSSLSITAGRARVTASGSNASVSRLGTLNISTGAVLDLANNKLVIDYASASPIQTVREHLRTGRIADQTSAQPLSYGYAESTELTLTPANEFFGQTVDATSLLLRPVLQGDADLDGAVAFSDLLALARNYNNSSGTAVWTLGDFDYDGNVAFTDLLALARNYNSSLGPAGDILPGDNSAFAADWALAVSMVPEPATLGLVATTALLTLRRRR